MTCPSEAMEESEPLAQMVRRLEDAMEVKVRNFVESTDYPLCTLEELEADNTELAMQLDEALQSVEQLRMQLSICEEELQTVRGTVEISCVPAVQAKEMQLALLDPTSIHAEDRVIELQEELSTKEQQHLKAQRKLRQECEDRVIELQEELSTKEQQHLEAQRKLRQECEDRVTELQEELSAKEQQHLEAQRKLSQDCEDRVTELQEELSAKQQQFLEAQTKLSQKREECTELREHVAALQVEMELVQAAAIELKQVLDREQQEFGCMHAELACKRALERSLVDARRACEDLQARFDARGVVAAATAAAVTAVTVRDLGRAQAEIHNLQDRVTELQEELSAKQQQFLEAQSTRNQKCEERRGGQPGQHSARRVRSSAGTPHSARKHGSLERLSGEAAGGVGALHKGQSRLELWDTPRGESTYQGTPSHSGKLEISPRIHEQLPQNDSVVDASTAEAAMEAESAAFELVGAMQTELAAKSQELEASRENAAQLEQALARAAVDHRQECSTFQARLHVLEQELHQLRAEAVGTVAATTVAASASASRSSSEPCQAVVLQEATRPIGEVGATVPAVNSRSSNGLPRRRAFTACHKTPCENRPAASRSPPPPEVSAASSSDVAPDSTPGPGVLLSGRQVTRPIGEVGATVPAANPWSSNGPLPRRAFTTCHRAPSENRPAASRSPPPPEVSATSSSDVAPDSTPGLGVLLSGRQVQPRLKALIARNAQR